MTCASENTLMEQSMNDLHRLYQSSVIFYTAKYNAVKPVRSLCDKVNCLNYL